MNTLREIALSLCKAGFGSLEFWFEKPIRSIVPWLKLIDKILKKRK